MPKKKFLDTKVGAFLSTVAPNILNIAGDILPDAGALGILKNLINKDKDMPEVYKEKALKLLEQDTLEMQEISSRWKNDMTSDSWLSKNTRPLTLIYLTVMTSLYIILDALDLAFDIDTSWVDLLKTLLVTTYVAYFGSRGYEKAKSMSKK
tara:strand:+ start:231 stop:683 length:453 start_codon:yes stop_codon:yes gene_type:complete